MWLYFKILRALQQHHKLLDEMLHLRATAFEKWVAWSFDGNLNELNT